MSNIASNNLSNSVEVGALKYPVFCCNFNNPTLITTVGTISRGSARIAAYTARAEKQCVQRSAYRRLRQSAMSGLRAGAEITRPASSPAQIVGALAGVAAVSHEESRAEALRSLAPHRGRNPVK
jgi:hypothetical protein